MSEKEENITYKVTDKRQFKPDGSLRDADEAPPQVADTEPVAPKVSPPPAADEPKPSESATAQPTPHEDAVQTAQEHSTQTAGGTTSHGAESQAPDFLSFIYYLATNAFANLGVVPHPVSNESTVDLETAKHFIDIIGMLETKTRGNLQPQEERFMAEILRDLRLQYVSLLNAPKK